MLRLLHISDLHFGPPYVGYVGEAVLSLIESLGPDMIVASGDFTQRAKEPQFAEARRFLDRLPDVPMVVTPGNHDVPLYRLVERLFRPYALYQQYICSQLDYVLHHPQACIVSLNSTAPRQAITNGRISKRQLEYCAECFRQANPDVVRIVVAHHHFAPAPDYEGGQVMPRAKRALDSFNKLNVELVLGGHLHRAYIGNSLDLYPSVDRDHGIIIIQAGTATSRRGRARETEKNSLNYVQVESHVIRITHFMYFADARGFVPISQHAFPRRGTMMLQDATGCEGIPGLPTP